MSVDLEPRIEDACLKDLGLFCSDKLEKGEVGIKEFSFFLSLILPNIGQNCDFGQL